MVTKSVDAVKKISAKKTGKKSVRKRKQIGIKASSKVLVKKPSVQGQEKKSLMWLVVACFMVLVVVGWVYFLRISLADDLNKRGGGFEEIANGFNRLFYTIDKKLDGVQNAFTDLQKAQMGLTDDNQADDQIQELREKVFPQFENINTNSNI